MSGMGESVGAAIEGGLFGRAVEPEHGEASDAPHVLVKCLNCGADVTGQYCARCGQRAHVHRSLAAIGHDILHGVLHLDGKFWNTLPLLAFKPGKLTRRYIEGERARFVSPMAMFLFSVFAMFAVFQMIGLSVPVDIENGTGDAMSLVVQEKIAGEARDLRAQIETLPEGDPERADLQLELTFLEGLLAAEDKNHVTTEIDLGVLRRMLSGGDPDGVSPGGEVDSNVTGIRWLDEGIIKKWQKNPSLMLYKLQANGYKFSWLLIPLSIPFLWLIFAWRREFKAYDHAVFITYSLAFMSLLFIMMSILAVVPGGDDWALLLLFVAAPLHIYRQLRHAYGLSRSSTLWRFIAVFLAVIIVMMLFVQILLVLGAF